MWRRALDIPQTSSRLLALNIFIFIPSLIQLCAQHRAKFLFLKIQNRDWCKRRRNAFQRRTAVLFGCVRDDGSLHFKVNNTERFLHPLLFHNDTGVFFNVPFSLSIRPLPQLTNWTFCARRHKTGTTTDTCRIYLEFVWKNSKEAEHRASSMHIHANKSRTGGLCR